MGETNSLLKINQSDGKQFQVLESDNLYQIFIEVKNKYKIYIRYRQSNL